MKASSGVEGKKLLAIILAGGKGTRLKSVDPETPKPLIKVMGKPVIFHQIDHFLKSGIETVYVLAGFKGELMRTRLAEEYGPRVEVIVETEPLGTGGALALMHGKLEDYNLVVSGDLIFDFDVARLLTFAVDNKADATLVVHPNTHPRDSDLVDLDEEGNVRRMLVRPHAKNLRYRNLVNASVMILQKNFWQVIPKNAVAENFEKDVLPRALQMNLKVMGYNTPEYIKDMGTPERLERVEADVTSGFVDKRSLRHKQRAIFLDRDGTLIKHKDYIIDPKDVELESGAAPALKAINASSYLAILVTNQPQAAMNMCSMEKIHEVHKALETLLGDQGIKLDAIFFCPHHPEKGHANEVKELKIACDCRKPKPGMLLAAAKQFNIDLAQSWMIGDTTRDGLAGERAGTRTVLVETGLGGKDGKYSCDFDYKCKNVKEAVELILKASPK